MLTQEDPNFRIATPDAITPNAVSAPSLGAVPAMLPTRLLQYRNAKVAIHYNSQTGYSDSGTLSYMDAQWIELTKDNGERLLIPLYAIRLVKLLEPSKLEGDAAVLLRPAEAHIEPRQITRE